MKPLKEFLDLFQSFGPLETRDPPPAKALCPAEAGGKPDPGAIRHRSAALAGSDDWRQWQRPQRTRRIQVLLHEAELYPRGSEGIYKQLTRTIPGVDLRGSVMAVDSYGGAVNAKGMADVTSVWQRSSIMKVQFQQYWDNPEEDAGRLQWMREFYTDLYSQQVDPKYAGTPYPNEYYEGCYINYPDCDMLAYAFWPQLYYGTTGSLPVSAAGEAAL